MKRSLRTRRAGRGLRAGRLVALALLATIGVGGGGACQRNESDTAASVPAAPAVGAPIDEATPAPAPRPVELRAKSDHASLRGVVLVVDSWERRENGVRVRIEISNGGPGVALAPRAPTVGTLLGGPSGGSVHPLEGSGSALDALATEGLPPGATLAAVLDFPDPGGESPWTLIVPTFQPLELPVPAPPAVAPTVPAETRPPNASTRIAAARPRAEPGPSPAAALERQTRLLLERQAHSLLRREEGAYLDTIHPRIREQERLYFRWSRQVPFSDVGLELVGFAPSGAAGSRLAAAVEMTVRLDEQPADNPFVYRLTYELDAPSAPESYVASGSADVGGGTVLVSAIRGDPRRPLFWRQPSLDLHRTHHFLLYVWPLPARDVLDVARDAEAAYLAILQRGLPLATRYVAHLVTDEALFRRAVGSPLAVGAAVSRQVRDGGTTRIDSRSFYLNGPLLAPFRIDRPDEEERRVTIAHELVHLALSAWTRPHTPPWLVEGAAVFYSGRLDFDSNRILVRSGLEKISLLRLTSATALGEHAASDGGERAAFEYLYAGNLVAHLVRQFGNDRFLAFYRSFAAVELDDRAGADDSDADVALDVTEEELARHFHLSLAALDQQVKASMRLRFR